MGCGSWTSGDSDDAGELHSEASLLSLQNILTASWEPFGGTAHACASSHHASSASGSQAMSMPEPSEGRSVAMLKLKGPATQLACALGVSRASSLFSLIQSANCVMRRGMPQSLHKDSTVSSSSLGRDVLLKSGPQASLSLQTSSICSKEYSGFHSCTFCLISPTVVSAVTGTANMSSVVSTLTSGTWSWSRSAISAAPFLIKPPFSSQISRSGAVFSVKMTSCPSSSAIGPLEEDAQKK